ncbi:MAG: nucleotidyltransferase domain-containing protein [Comamonadaceae bacterium]|nr:nucleotidyltransferase domain-containing protein [Comamonadaceae bacterium]
MPSAARVDGTAGPQSDLDLAVLVAGYADALLLFDPAGELADVAGCPVDLMDLGGPRRLVVQYRIITTGQRWWECDAQAALFEAVVLSEKTALDTARAPGCWTTSSSSRNDSWPMTCC